MSVAGVLPPATTEQSEPPAGAWGRLAQWLASLADRLNPILVKEARQALKSPQFVVTFGLLLLAAWIWSVFGVALLGPSALYGARGSEMFRPYYVMLAFPLLVVVPFGAYRSLSAEREDRTFELLYISTLRPWQIISGKLASASLQMLLYLSAITPCLAFTYLLRGIDVPTIFVLVAWLCLFSLGLSLVGLFLATIARDRNRHIVLTVVVIVALFGVFFWTTSAVVFGLIDAGIPVDRSEFWIVQAGALTIYASYMALFTLASAAQLAFTSANRSTSIRLVLAVQQALFIGWAAWAWLFEASGDEGIPLVLVAVLILHWWVAGSFLIGESPHLSHRVRRGLPTSFLGRLLFTWLNPGPASALVLVLCQLLAGVGLAAGALWVVPAIDPAFASNWSSQDAARTARFGGLGVCFVAIYLGLGKLVGDLARRMGWHQPLLPALANWVLSLAGMLVPVTLQLASPDLRSNGYSVLQLPNVVWTLTEVSASRTLSPEAALAMVVVPGLALIVVGLNLPGIFREVRFVREAPPERVAAEDAELQAAQAPPAEPAHQSPWD